MRQAALLTAFIFLSGCASSPSWVKPWTWFGHEEPAPDAEVAQPYPNLSTVPAKPKDMTAEDKRKQLAEGLIADRANAVHNDEVLRGITETPASASGSTPSPANPASAPQAAPAPAAPKPQAAALPAAQPAPAPAAASAPVATPVADPGVVELDFAAGSTKMDPAEAAKLSTLAAIQKEGGGHIRVVGHAGDEPVKAKDDAGRKLALFDLSMRRAQAVANEFLRLGVTGTALIVEARGSDDGEMRKVDVSLE